MKVKTTELPYGIVYDGKKIVPAGEALLPYTLELLEPVDTISSVTVKAPTLGDALAAMSAAAKQYEPNSEQFVQSILHTHIARRCEPALTPEQLDEMTGVDHDALKNLITIGATPAGDYAFRRDPEREYITTATTRLHKMSDRKKAEQRMSTSAKDDPTLHEAYLTWLVTRFGDPDEKAFDGKPVEFSEFLHIAWNDFTRLTATTFSRDYKSITDVLDGKVEVDGKTIPFQGSPEGGDGQAQAPRKRGKAD